MKKLIIAASLMLAALGTSYGQGTLDFFNGNPINAPVFDTDTTTKLGTASGALANLYVGAPGGSLVAVGSPVPFANTLSGAPNGFIKITSTDRARAVPGMAPGSDVDVQVRAWKGAADFASATTKGQSITLHLKLGAVPDPATGIPSPPTALTGLQSFSLVVPEPSTIALGLMGVAALLIRRRK